LITRKLGKLQDFVRAVPSKLNRIPSVIVAESPTCVVLVPMLGDHLSETSEFSYPMNCPCAFVLARSAAMIGLQHVERSFSGLDWNVKVEAW
jgi:hypothetical protein